MAVASSSSDDSVISDLRKLKDAISTGNRTCVLELDARYKTIIAPLTLTTNNPSYSNMQTDGLAETLAPTDIPFSKVRPVKTTGNGDCLFNATSLYLKAIRGLRCIFVIFTSDESLASPLRLLSACDLYLNANFYSDHPILEEAASKPSIMTTDKKTLFSVLLTNVSANRNDIDLEECVRLEAMHMCETKTWSSMLQVLSLPNVVKTDIYSAYPDTSHGIRPLLNGHIRVRNSISSPSTKRNPFIVLWSRDGNLDARTGSLFQPNHFCAILPTAETVSCEPKQSSNKRKCPPSQSNYKNTTKVSKPNRSKQGTLFSFFEKKSDKVTKESTIKIENNKEQSLQHDIENVCERSCDQSSDNKTSPLTQSVSENSVHTPDNKHIGTHSPVPVDPSEVHVSTLPRNVNCNALCCSSLEPFHPTDTEILDGSVRIYKNREWTCQASWFVDYPWLTYCITNNRVYCSTCQFASNHSLILFSTKSETNFMNEGFNNWKKAPAKFREHEQSHTHKEVVKKVEFAKKWINVQSSIHNQNKADQANHRECLIKQLKSLKFMLRQGLPVRGKREGERNFDQLMMLRADDSPLLNNWVQQRTYQSPIIINEQINLMGHNLLRKLIQKISEVKWYSILADETRDISNREQLSISIRWVDEHFVVYEDFIGMIQVDDTKAATILLSIKDVLLRLCLPLNNCRGQGYDGASNFMGHINGVAVKIRQEVPQAIVVHCFAHCLNLGLQDSCRQIKAMRDAIDLVKEIASLIKWSPKRQVLFEKLQVESGKSTATIKPLCPTRWTVRTSAISSVLDNYEVLIDTMDEVNASGNDDYSRRAGGISTLMQKFNTYFGLHLSHMLFAATEQLSITLQNKDSCVVDAKNGCRMLMSFCARQRTDDSFEVFYEKIETMSQNITETPCLPRYKRVPKRLDCGEDSVKFDNTKDYFRQQYFEAIDCIQNHLERRLLNKNIDVVEDIERLVIDAANGVSVDVPVSVSNLYKDDIDMQKLQAQLPLMEDMIKGSALKVDKVSSIRTVCDILNNEPGAKKFMSAVVMLIQMYFTIPVTTATAERSFSTLRRLKTYLRSTMSQERLNNMMLLHCHKDETDQINILQVASEFVAKNKERMEYFGKF